MSRISCLYIGLIAVKKGGQSNEFYSVHTLQLVQFCILFINSPHSLIPHSSVLYVVFLYFHVFHCCSDCLLLHSHMTSCMYCVISYTVTHSCKIPLFPCYLTCHSFVCVMQYLASTCACQ
jgi:hypothetical protein